MKIWYFRYAVGHGRTWNRHCALAKIWKDEDFSLFYPEDLPDLCEQESRADLAIVAGRKMAKRIRAQGLDLEKRAAFRVLFPTFWRGQRGQRDCSLHIREIRRGKYHLIFPDQTMFLDRYRDAHPKVYYVDRGFDPTFLYPAPEEKRVYGIIFIGNRHACERMERLKRLRDVYSGRVVWGRVPYRKMPAYLRAAKIGWNQILYGPPIDDSCINYRVWEVLGSKTMLLCNYSKDIPLIPDMHYVAWYSDADLMRKAKFFLGHDKYRRQIAEDGHKEALAKHTWHHRALEYKEIIASYM